MRSPLRRAAARAGVVALVFGVTLTLGTATASAHAVLVGSSPAQSAHYPSGKPPHDVWVAFDEAVNAQPDSLAVYDGQGRQAALQGRRSTGKRIGVRLPRLADGSYVVVWHVVSDDGHPEQGAFTFSVGAGSATTADISSLVASRGAGRGIGIGFGLDRGVAFFACLVVAGGLVFTRWKWGAAAASSDVSRVLIAAAIVGVVATLLSIPLQAAYSTGRSSNLFHGTALGDVVSARFGQAALVRAALLVVLAVLVLARNRRSHLATAASALLGLGVFATYAYAGHGNTGRWRALGFVTDVAHLGAAALWLGGVAVLVVALRDRTPSPGVADAAAGFSALALPAVAVVVLSGMAQGWRQIGSWHGLWHTSYARLLVIKALVVLAIVVIASAARDALSDRAAARGASAAGTDADLLHDVRSSVRVEALLAVVVLAVTATLVVTPPAREAEAAAHRPTPHTLRLEAKGASTRYAVVVQPDLPGTNTIVLAPERVKSVGFLPVSMTGTVRQAGAASGRRLTFVALEDGRWVTTAPLSTAGTWTVALSGDTVGGHDAATLDITLP